MFLSNCACFITIYSSQLLLYNNIVVYCAKYRCHFVNDLEIISIIYSYIILLLYFICITSIHLIIISYNETNVSIFIKSLIIIFNRSELNKKIDLSQYNFKCECN